MTPQEVELAAGLAADPRWKWEDGMRDGPLGVPDISYPPCHGWMISALTDRAEISITYSRKLGWRVDIRTQRSCTNVVLASTAGEALAAQLMFVWAESL